MAMACVSVCLSEHVHANDKAMRQDYTTATDTGIAAAAAAARCGDVRSMTSAAAL